MINSRRMKWAGHVARKGRKTNVNRDSVGNTEETTRRPIYRWEDNIKTNLIELGWGDMD
jgi:hypothetical protein